MNRPGVPPHSELGEVRGGETKDKLRAALLLLRAKLHAAKPLAGQTLSALYPRIDGPPGMVASYWPFRSEMDPRPLMQRFARAGWRLALPVTPPKGEEGSLTFRVWNTGADMAVHPFGMSEPHPSAEAVRPDLLFVPLLAFDGRGHRLGYGAGHYDRTLEGLRAAGPVRTIGLAFAGQQVDRLPAEAHDQLLDAILTERTFTEFAKPAG